MVCHIWSIEWCSRPDAFHWERVTGWSPVGGRISHWNAPWVVQSPLSYISRSRSYCRPRCPRRIILCAQLTRDLFVIAKFLLKD